MGSNCSVLLHESELEEIKKETGFSYNQIIRLYSRFTRLDKGSKGFLNKEDFLTIPELAINPLADRITQAFFTANPKAVNFKTFTRILATFLPHPSKREDKLKLIFNLYDIDNDKKIHKEELMTVLQMMVGSNISDKRLADIVDKTMEASDIDKDGDIGYEDFKKVL
ncbi:DgyrCDS5171 [Dimorphilus gyrociliatus]|uniref:DgyrCDS5171 n=1 Tax=Dimorphilus gyrociliatus TaxID=2664684 RepID=A0A7I8VJ08_9ANNE|nr:DgyrCDS5171 [Dimorphilus gyrociliatus]